MAKYEYRCLSVKDMSRMGNSDQVWKSIHKEWKTPKFWYLVRDSGRSDPLLLTDEVRDDHATFTQRADAAFVGYLNALGNEGWKLISYSIETYSGTNSDWPRGTYLFMRELE